MDKYRERHIRSGDEPTHARSPLRLRLVLAVFGAVSAAFGVWFFAVEKEPGVAIAFAGIGAMALADIAVIIHRIRQGPHWQPGRDVPPYRPVEVHAERQPERPLAQSTRRHVYLAMMSVCLTLVILAWTWVRLFSPTAAVLMSLVAAFIPPLAAIVANARGQNWDWDDETGDPYDGK